MSELSELHEAILALAGDVGGELAYPPHAIAQVAEAVADEVARGHAGEAVSALLEVAMFLDTQARAPDAARELTGMAQRLAALVHDATIDQASAAPASDDERAAAARVVGADAPARALTGGAPPADATPASPLARFLLQRDEKKGAAGD